MIDDLINQYFPEFNLISNRIYNSNEDEICFVNYSTGPLESLILCLCYGKDILRFSTAFTLIMTYPIYIVRFENAQKSMHLDFRWHHDTSPDLSSIVPTEFGILIPPVIEKFTESGQRINIIRLGGE